MPDARGRGRPQASPEPYPAGPMDIWLTDRSPTARRLLAAARDLLLRKGFGALTLEAVALEAGEDRATITRHFGGKAGLIHALFDYLGEDIYEGLVARSQEFPEPDQQRHALTRSLGELASDPQLTLGMIELVGHSLRDTVLRERFAALYEYYRETVREQLGMNERLAVTPDAEDRQDIQALSAIVLAVIDGMSSQLGFDPHAVDRDRVFALLDLFVFAVLDGRLRTKEPDPEVPS
jgi:AcrR family transcriptional regulator